MEAIGATSVSTLESVGRHVRRDRPPSHVRDDVGELGGDEIGRTDTADRRPFQLIGRQCRPTHFGDCVSGFGDVVGDCPQRIEIDFGVSPQITALPR